MTRYDTPPRTLRSLEQRIRNLEGDEGLVSRRRVAMSLVVVGQMLPSGAVKGGSAMALRFGKDTRFTQDLDAARSGSLSEFRSDFEETLAAGWAGFTGRLIDKQAPSPTGVPAAYIMRPFEVKLDFQGRPWCTVKFELGHNEIGDAEEPEYRLAPDLAALFTDAGLEAPRPIPVMRADHQIAQKLHALSTPGSDRAHDLVDLQLLDAGEVLDLQLTRATCTRLFEYRRQQVWPPRLAASSSWTTLYAEAAEGLEVLATVNDAIAWANGFVNRIAMS